MASHVRATAAAGAVAGYLALQWLGRSYGATRAERQRRLPGDDLMAAPMAVTTHAITVDAPPERIWPWLVQMGWHRGAWYTAEWVDRLLFPANGPSADRIPDGPPDAGGCGLPAGVGAPGRFASQDVVGVPVLGAAVCLAVSISDIGHLSRVPGTLQPENVLVMFGAGRCRAMIWCGDSAGCLGCRAGGCSLSSRVAAGVRVFAAAVREHGGG